MTRLLDETTLGLWCRLQAQAHIEKLGSKSAKIWNVGLGAATGLAVVALGNHFGVMECRICDQYLELREIIGGWQDLDD